MIHIGQAVPSIGRALKGVASVWDQVLPLSLVGSSPVLHRVAAKAEYVVACSASCEAVWLQKLLSDIFDLQLDATCIHCDNESCVKLSENPVFHDKLKHIKIKYHYIRDMV